VEELEALVQILFQEGEVEVAVGEVPVPQLVQESTPVEGPVVENSAKLCEED